MHTAPTVIYTLSLHDALPISFDRAHAVADLEADIPEAADQALERFALRRGGLSCEQDQEIDVRSEEHTSELQSLAYLVCRLLLEKKTGRESSYPCSTNASASG